MHNPAPINFRFEAERVQEMLRTIKKEEKEKQIEKIAFSLFCMYYYNYHFKFERDDYLIDTRIKSLKEIWKLGKLKNKVQYFFNLAEKFNKLDFNI